MPLTLTVLEARTLAIPFKQSFSHASAIRRHTQTLWIAARDQAGRIGHGEGCPREYVTAENLSGAQAFVARYRQEWCAGIVDLQSLAHWVRTHDEDIDTHPAAWCAVELALLDLLGKATKQSVEQMLGLPRVAGSFRYTAVLGDATPAQFEAQLGRYLQAGLREFKIKLSGDAARDRSKVETLAAAGISPAKVRADANNLWANADAAIDALAALHFPFFAIEEPLRCGDYAGMQAIATALGTRIILDESLVRAEQLDQLNATAGHWIVNLRVSKMGGLLRSLDLIDKLRQCGVPIIVGAHVGETSVLTRAALPLAMAAQDLLLAQEGAFGTHLLVHDVVKSPLMFGPGGKLDSAVTAADAPGWGLAIDLAALSGDG